MRGMFRVRGGMTRGWRCLREVLLTAGEIPRKIHLRKIRFREFLFMAEEMLRKIRRHKTFLREFRLTAEETSGKIRMRKIRLREFLLTAGEALRKIRPRKIHIRRTRLREFRLTAVLILPKMLRLLRVSLPPRLAEMVFLLRGCRHLLRCLPVPLLRRRPVARIPAGTPREDFLRLRRRKVNVWSRR